MARDKNGYCDNCGTKYADGCCPNCHESLHIFTTQSEYLPENLSDEFVSNVRKQKSQVDEEKFLK